MPKRGRKRLNVRVKKTKVISKPVESGREEFDGEKVEQEKRLFMWVGVSCIMAVFFIVWIFNLKYQFSVNAGKSDKSNFNWTETKAQLNEAMDQVKQGIAEIKQAQSSAQNTLPQESELTNEQINILKGKLMDEVGYSTASSSKIQNE